MCAYICILHTRVHPHTCTGRASGACRMHTTYSNALLNIKGNYPSPWCTDLSEFLNQRNGLWTRQIPSGLVSRPLPGTVRRIRAVIPTFRFPLIWSWHRGDGLLCISPSQDGGLFTWSPPDWIWSVSHLLCRPPQPRQKNADFFPFHWVRSALSRVKYYSPRYVHYGVPICLKLDLMDTCCGYYSVVLDSPDEGQISFINVTVEMDRSAHLSSLTDSTNVTTTTPTRCTPSRQMWEMPANSAPFETAAATPPCKCICNERRVREVHYSLSATFISEYQMNVINVERGGGGGSKVSRGYEMSDIVITPPTMSSRSWDSVRLQRGEHTHAHRHTSPYQCAALFVCPSPSELPSFAQSRPPPIFQAETQSHTSCELMRCEVTTGAGEDGKNRVTVQTAPLFSVMKARSRTHMAPLTRCSRSCVTSKCSAVGGKLGSCVQCSDLQWEF